ncbi:MAG: efflux RND transporter permease subunit [Mangrovibacterium sp.]
MKLSEFSVKYPVTISMVVLGVLLLGYISYDKLGVELFPNMNNPKLYIELEAGERPPEEIEKQYVEQLEGLAIRQSDVTNVSSISMVGTAQVTVEYAWDKDMDDAFLDLQKAVNSYAQNDDNIDAITISQYDPNTSPIVEIALSNDNIDDLNELRKTAENYIRNELIRLDGIADVEISGAQEQEVYIETQQYLLDAYGLTLSSISTAINNFNQRISGGNIEEMGTKYVVKAVSLLSSVEDFESIIVGYKTVKADDESAQSAPIFLKELASVRIKNKDAENMVRLNGQASLGLSIYKETSYNTVQAVENVEAAMRKIEKALPSYRLTKVSDQGTFIDSAIGEVQDSALLGILLAVFILYVFLRRIGSTLIISIAIPISIVATFNLMYFNGLSINIMSLGGLALGAGMLVDNAIVVVENIFRNRDNGMSVFESAIVGTSQVSGAILSSTLTTIVVFLPIVYLHGSAGELFKDQAWTVTFSLVSSLLVAILVIPMLFTLFYKNTKNKPVETVQISSYGRFLGRVINQRWIVILFSVLLMLAGLFMVPFLGSEFMPKTETREFSMSITMAEGTQLTKTNSTVVGLEHMASELLGDNLQYTYTHIGPSSSMSSSTSSIFEGENTATIKYVLNENATISSSEAIRLLSSAVGEIDDIEILYKQDETALQSILGTDDAPLLIEVEGEELETIDEIMTQIQERLIHVEGIYNAESSMEEGSPEVEIEVDRLRAGMYGISVSTIVGQVQSQLAGETVGQVERSGEMQDITLKMPDMSLADMQRLKITSGDQEFYLDELATIKEGFSPKKIMRNNQTRIGQVSAQLENTVSLSKVAEEIRLKIADIALPLNYKIEITGEEAKRQDSMDSLSFALILSIILVFMVLASQFESLLHPFTILLTIPLAVVGSIFTFFIFGKSLNMMAFIGIIMLAGIAVNNSILLIDRIIQLQRGGIPRREAILQAGQQRIRPIMMTSLTTILALIPMTLGIGESAALRSPMAMAVIGGMITSTLLSLVVIPCVYDVFESIKSKLFNENKND